MLNSGDVDTKVTRPFIRNRVWILYPLFGATYSALFVLGVVTESDNILALVWPANAFMLGMLIRFPLLARAPGWIACLVGLAVAFPIVGYGLVVSGGLAAYNLGVVVTGYLLLSRFDPIDQRLERPISIFYLLYAVVAAAVVAGIAGSALVDPLFRDPSAVSAFRYWFSAELLNQLAVLPMILAFPGYRQWARQMPHTLSDQAPIIVYVLSAVVGIFFGGMAVLAFPVPALLWCAISYRVFLTALLTFAFCAWAVVATASGYVDVSNLNQSLVLSISMGAALVSLGPLIIATTTATRNEVLDQLRYLATEREIVANELEHRIKNLFALVNGLISLSVRDNPDMAPLANTLKNRLVALQQAHGLIRAGNAASGGSDGLTSLHALIGALLRPYEADGRFIIAGDDALIEAGVVTPLALVFHELVTNSTKYGALSDPKGALEIQTSRNADDVHIKWTETGSGPHRRPAATTGGFGSKLLDLTIKSQLRGDYTRSWGNSGVDIEMVLPGKLFRDPSSEAG